MRRLVWFIVAVFVLAGVIVLLSIRRREHRTPTIPSPQIDPAHFTQVTQAAEGVGTGKAIETEPFRARGLIVRVRDEQSRPVQGAIVGVMESEALKETGSSDSSGIATFVGTPDGAYIITAFHNVKGSRRSSARVKDGAGVAELTLMRKGVIRGRVVAWDDTPLPGVRVVLSHYGDWAGSADGPSYAPEHVRYAVPDAEGYFEVAGLNASVQYRIECRHDDHVIWPAHPLWSAPDSDPIGIYMYPVFVSSAELVHRESNGPICLVGETSLRFEPASEGPFIARLTSQLHLAGSRPIRDLFLPQDSGNVRHAVLVGKVNQHALDQGLAGTWLAAVPGFEPAQATCVAQRLSLWSPSQARLSIPLRAAAAMELVRFKALGEPGLTMAEKPIAFALSPVGGNTEEARVGFLRFDTSSLSDYLAVPPGPYLPRGGYGLRNHGEVQVRKGEAGAVQTVPLTFERGADFVFQANGPGGKGFQYWQVNEFKGLDDENSLLHLRNIEVFNGESFTLWNVPPGRYFVRLSSLGAAPETATLTASVGTAAEFKPTLRLKE